MPFPLLIQPPVLTEPRPANDSTVESRRPKGVLAMLCVLLLSACGPAELPVDRATRDGVLIISNGTEPATFDPQVMTGIPERDIALALFEPLVTYNEQRENQIEPGVAERWEVSADGRVWTFFLRDNARWSNGDAVTAQDFIFMFNRVLEPAMACAYAELFYSITGAQDYHQGKSVDFSQVGVTAIDEHTLLIEMDEPAANFLNDLSSIYFAPVHRATLESYGEWTDRSGAWTRPGRIVSNGPFQLVEWSPDQKVRVEPNPYYWDRDSVRLRAIEFMAVSDLQAELRMYESGLLHKTNTTPANERDRLRQTHPQEFRMDDMSAVYFYRINTTHEVLNDVRLRQALSLSVDREAIIGKITKGGERPAWGYTPGGLAGYATPQLIEYNPDRARQLLADAGYPEGRGLPVVELLYNTSENHRTIAEAVQNMWVRELGIQVSLNNKEWKVFLEETRLMHHQISRAGWVGSPNPGSFLRYYMTGQPNNMTGFSHPRFDELVSQGLRTLDKTKRFELYLEAEEILLNSHAVIPVYWYTNTYLVHSSVRNWTPSLTDSRPYKYVYLEPATP